MKELFTNIDSSDSIKSNGIKKIIQEIFHNEIHESLLVCGGAAGHMQHPFDFVKNGKELIDVFRKSIDSLKKNKGSVKIDGINTSIRLVNDKFVIDRGSAKPLDIKGVRPEELVNRFGELHGMVNIGKNVINIFDSSYKLIYTELKSLGMIDNPNIMLNIEYVEGQSNIMKYDKNFLAIHGLIEISPANIDKSGKIKSRKAREISYNQGVLNSMIDKINTVSGKYNFKILGSVYPAFKSNPNLNSVLSESVTINYSSGAMTKKLSEWLRECIVPVPMITKDVYLKIESSKNVNADFPVEDVDNMVNGYIIWKATIDLGDEILRNLTSEIGDLNNQEGVVIRDSSINPNPFKITGSFAIKVMGSKFKK